MKLPRLLTTILLTSVALAASAAVNSTTTSTHASFRGVKSFAIPNTNATTPSSPASTSRTSLRANLQAKAAQYTRATVRNLHVISSDDVRRTVEEAQVKETLEIPQDIDTPDGTVFGGISGITYDKDRKVYYALTNDVLESHEPPPDKNSTVGLPCTPTGQESCPVARCIAAPEGCNYVFDHYVVQENGRCCPSLCYAVNANGVHCPLNPDDIPPDLPDPNNPPLTAAPIWRQQDTTSSTILRPTTYPPTMPSNVTIHRPRFYTLEFDDQGNTKILEVTYLKDANHNDYKAGTVKPQAIVYNDGQLFISLDRGPKTSSGWRPQIVEYNSTGFYQGQFQYPSYFRVQDVGFTALTITPKQDTLVAATGKGLFDDRPEYIRFVEFDLDTRQSGNQYVYQAEETVVGMVSLDDNGGFAVLERSNVIPEYDWRYYHTLPPIIVNGVPTIPISRNDDDEHLWEGYDATLYYALTLDAINVQTVNDLKNVHTLNTMRRDRMFVWKNVTKFEAMGNDAGWRRKSDEDDEDDEEDTKSTKSQHRRRHRSSKRHRERELSYWYDELDVIIMSDNEFEEEKPTDTLFVELNAKEMAVLNPAMETAEVLDDGASGKAALDPAIWVHPNSPDQSLIVTALSMRDIGVYSLTGELKQRVGNDGDSMGVDIMYAFKLDDDDLMDIAIVSDGTNNRLRIYKIQTDNGDNYLTGITDGSMPTIERPKGVAAYLSPYTGKQYAFVQSRDDFIVQIELLPTNDMQRVTGQIAREIYLPSKSGGLVVDNELGYLYVTLPDNIDKSIVKYDAEPNEYKDSEIYPATIVDGNVEGEIKGLTMYYGDQGDGYLVVSVSGDSTFAVFEREKDNEYYDSFTIGKNKDEGVDKTDNTQGITITNLKLGEKFKCGLFVAQDFNNEQAKVDGLPSGELVNSNTNFKLVPFEELAENMYYYLDVDTDSWDPRRYSLVVWINSIGQDIYIALGWENISGRDAEKLLFYLNEATRHLYPRSAKKQQMISLIDPFEEDARRRRLDLTIEERRQETRRRIQEDESRTDEERRELKRKECKHRRRLSVKPDDAKDDLRDFIDHLESLRWAGRVNDDNYNSWKDLAEEIKDAIPDEN